MPPDFRRVRLSHTRGGQEPSDYEDFYRNRLSQIPSVAQVKTLLSLSTLKEFKGYNLEAALE